ncbi:MAG TPA: ferrochelatase [Nitrospirae bacterium]|nr:ferrochelatase [bacterium BMS3Abin06]GBE31670.1 ferrochelatase [bacterium BMS3Bbin05]HDH11656.1 ferrochelatase [Nitrospirota bacterium]HDZ02076.1 ferrochelatase [Nitrospirota bacterium]
MTNKKKDITGIVLLNLGGPDSLRAVRPFLYNLFSDREIIRLGPSFLQKPIAWLISALRSKKAEEMYSRIGGKSPILDITTAQAEALEKALNGSRFTVHGSRLFRVYIGMRYWHPFIKDTVQRIIDDGIKHLIVLSLYPHYSKATTGSSVSEFKKRVEGKEINIQYIEPWYDFPPYIEALADLIAGGLSDFNETGLHLLYSAHSLPESFIREGDPYLDHIKSTIEKVNERLALAPYNFSGLNWHLSFQSKTGPVKWLEPATEETIKNLATSGCRNLFVIPISFVSDHIETLYEIDILYKEIAQKHGINLRRCRSLNISDKFILAMRDLIVSKIK